MLLTVALLAAFPALGVGLGLGLGQAAATGSFAQSGPSGQSGSSGEGAATADATGTGSATPGGTRTVEGTATATDLPRPTAADDGRGSDTATRSPTPTPTPADPTADPTTDPSGEPTGEEPVGEEPFAVDDAVFRWGINDESNNRAFAPGTYNFLSAGVTPDPGKGGQTIVNRKWRGTNKTAWRASRGNVAIEKVTPDGTKRATWAGLSVGPGGEQMPSPTSGIFSHHQVVISGGAGTINPEAGTARIEWKGSFSVLFYSGMTFYAVTDPTLVVTPTSARITATAAGYASSMEDLSKWGKVPARTVTLARLDAVDLTEPLGFTAQARYRKQTYDAPAKGVPQESTGPHWGAFPNSLLGFLEEVGMAAYWYSSGGQTDAYKIPHPVTVSWDSTSPIPPDPPDPGTIPAPTPSNPVAPPPPPPPAVPGVQPPAPPVPAAPPVDSAPGAPAAPAQPVSPGEAGPAETAQHGYQPPAVYALTSATTPPDTTSDHRWEWWIGGLLLLAAAGMTVSTPLLNRRKGRP